MLSLFSDLEGKRPNLSAQGLITFGRILMEGLFPFTAPDLKAQLLGSQTEQYPMVISRVDGPGNIRIPLSRLLEAEAKMTAVAVADLDAGKNQITNLIPPRLSGVGGVTSPCLCSDSASPDFEAPHPTLSSRKQQKGLTSFLLPLA